MHGAQVVLLQTAGSTERMDFMHHVLTAHALSMTSGVHWWRAQMGDPSVWGLRTGIRARDFEGTRPREKQSKLSVRHDTSKAPLAAVKAKDSEPAARS